MNRTSDEFEQRPDGAGERQAASESTPKFQRTSYNSAYDTNGTLGGHQSGFGGSERSKQEPETGDASRHTAESEPENAENATCKIEDTTAAVFNEPEREKYPPVPNFGATNSTDGDAASRANLSSGAPRQQAPEFDSYGQQHGNGGDEQHGRHSALYSTQNGSHYRPDAPGNERRGQYQTPHHAPNNGQYDGKPVQKSGQYEMYQPGKQAAPAKRKGGAGVMAAWLLVGCLIGGVAGGGTVMMLGGGSGGSQSNADKTKAAEQSQGFVEVKGDRATAASAVAAAKIRSAVKVDVFLGQKRAGYGSGVVYREDGYIITHAHVVSIESGETPNLRVELSDGRLTPAKIVGIDPYADIAVIKVDMKGLTPIKFAESDKVAVGDLIVAVGAPLDLSNTVTSGIVSTVNRGIVVPSSALENEQRKRGNNDQGRQRSGSQNENDSERRFDRGQRTQQPAAPKAFVTLPVIQTDASINPGNSGGAMLNANGDLVGINVAIKHRGDGGSIGLGFAVPSNLVKRVVEAIMAGQQPTHGFLGAIPADNGENYNANHAGGFLARVEPGSPAEKAGLRAGDVIKSINGVGTADSVSLSAVVRMFEGGAKVKVVYDRKGQQHEVEVQLGTLQ
ncbi:MAG: trypsin-like peptidase domain-containing protein [Microbacteriaceae bacterium]|nr:trypsin-like peptidase domain-containing protein [Microbacteriaceae bacterium]